MNAPTFSSFLPVVRARRLRILCAEDNPLVADVLLCLLTRSGHNVSHACDGREAWSVLSQDLGAFDLLITDHQMPEIGGVDLVGLLRQTEFAGRIIVYSSSLNEHDRAQYRLLGVDAVVEKSSVPAHLLAAVEPT